MESLCRFCAQGAVYARHYALNWLIGYMDQDWDDISTDT
nr:DUF4272 domain-containing protein [Rhizobium sp. NZLR1]